MKKIAETSRTFLREFQFSDRDHLYALNADPQVLKYTGDTPFSSVSEAAEFLTRYNEYRKYGRGRWAVVSKNNGDFLGWCGLKYHPDEGITEVGFRFFRKYWGQGYATESAGASLEYGFQSLRLPCIYAHSHVDNTASLRVIEKLGMTRVKDFDYDGMPARMFVRESPHYNIRLIDGAGVLELRHRVLRKGRPFEEAVFPGDELGSTFHYGAFFDGRLVGVVTLMLISRPGIKEEGAYQLRGMAVDDAFRGRGVGNQLLKRVEEEVLARNGQTIWMNAREGAVGFYKRAGYHLKGGMFEIPGVGPHFYMQKSLNSVII